MPTSALKPTAMTMMSGRISIGQPNCAASRWRAEQPERDADEPAGERQRQRLDQELRQDVARLGADRHADADLARPLGHAHQHDVHDPDAADQQRHRGDARRAAWSASCVPSCCALAISARLRMEKSSSAPGCDVVALAQQRR